MMLGATAESLAVNTAKGKSWYTLSLMAVHPQVMVFGEFDNCMIAIKLVKTKLK